MADPLNRPADFDHCLVDSQDIQAARAIDASLKRARIPVFSPKPSQLWIRLSDRAAAEPIAAEIFARRARAKSLPRQKTEPDIDIPDRSFGYLDSGWGE